jgi:glutathione synthase/RimK-type ligase-like ATP-grasp enzyme
MGWAMAILILGNSKDTHAAHLNAAIAQTGTAVEYLDIAQFPTQLQMSWSPQTLDGILALPSGQRWPLSEIRSVFWRSLAAVRVPSLPDAQQQQMAVNDAMGLLRTVMQGTSMRWVNSWHAYQFHKEKPRQLAVVRQLGVTIPDTWVGNDAPAVLEFAQRHAKVIFKPVYGGAYIQPLTPQHLQLDRLRLALACSPITLQEYIPGTNIRTYVIGDRVYGAEIRSPSLDFRLDRGAELVPLGLPDSVVADCHAIAQALGLVWTAIDWRRRPDGQYVFLEANPSPMFIHFERQTQYPITQALVSLLLAS